MTSTTGAISEKKALNTARQQKARTGGSCYMPLSPVRPGPLCSAPSHLLPPGLFSLPLEYPTFPTKAIYLLHLAQPAFHALS